MDPPPVEGQLGESALRHLEAYGIAGTTLQDIAGAAGISEEHLVDRYGDEEGLLRALLAPLRSGLEEITTSAADADLRDRAALHRVIGGYMDVLIAHRTLARTVLVDPTADSSDSVRAVRAVVLGLRDELARGTGSLESNLRASSALGAVQSAVLEPTEFDRATVRDVTIDAAVAILLS